MRLNRVWIRKAILQIHEVSCRKQTLYHKRKNQTEPLSELNV